MQVVKRPIMVMIAVVGMLVAALGFSSAASAYPPGTAPTLAASTTTPAEGSSFTLTGAHFYPDEAVTIDLHSDAFTIGTATADRNGFFSGTVTRADGVTGEHTIVATGASGDSASISIDIIASGSGTGSGSGSGSGGGGSLSATGVATMTIGGFGLLLLVGGGLMLLAGRRRKAVV